MSPKQRIVEEGALRRRANYLLAIQRDDVALWDDNEQEEAADLIEDLLAALEQSAARLREVEMRVMELEMERAVPGQMVCDACTFQLTTTILDVAHGRVGAPIAPSAEPCPNGCGPLRPLTWREDVKRADESMMRAWDALAASVKLQSHYAELLNMHDGGQRLTFESPAAWMNRLDTIKAGAANGR